MQRLKTLPLLLAAGILGMQLAGCATTSGIEASGKVVAADSGNELNKSIVINNRALASDLEITDIRSTFIGNLLKAQISIRSTNRDTFPIQYKFEWLDAQGFELNANQAWKPFLVYGKETKTIQGVAPNQAAKEFKIKIRDPDSE